MTASLTNIPSLQRHVMQMVFKDAETLVNNAFLRLCGWGCLLTLVLVEALWWEWGHVTPRQYMPPFQSLKVFRFVFKNFLASPFHLSSNNFDSWF